MISSSTTDHYQIHLAIYFVQVSDKTYYLFLKNRFHIQTWRACLNLLEIIQSQYNCKQLKERDSIESKVVLSIRSYWNWNSNSRSVSTCPLSTLVCTCSWYGVKFSPYFKVDLVKEMCYVPWMSPFKLMDKMACYRSRWTRNFE